MRFDQFLKLTFGRIIVLLAELLQRLLRSGAQCSATLVSLAVAQQLLVETEDNRRMLIDASEVLTVIGKGK